MQSLYYALYNSCMHVHSYCSNFLRNETIKWLVVIAARLCYWCDCMLFKACDFTRTSPTMTRLHWTWINKLQTDIDTTACWLGLWQPPNISFDSSWVYASIKCKLMFLSPQKALSSSSHGLAQINTACSKFLCLGTCMGLLITNDLSWSSKLNHS